MHKSPRAFTLIEFMIVVGIIGFLVGLAMFTLGPIKAKAKDGRRVSDIKQIRTALEMYKVNFGVYPSQAEFVVNQALSRDGYLLMRSIPGNPDKSAYGTDCQGDEYLYVPSGDTYKIYYCLGNKTGEIPAGKCIGTPATMCEPDTTGTYGSGGDGSLVIASNSNINTMMSNGRTCADAVSYRVSAMTTNTLTLSSSPSTACLAVGDELFIINQQGVVTDYANVGNYEIGKIKQISGSEITLTSALTKSFGNPATQIINAQRIPQYQDLAVNANLTASAWNGTNGGLLVLKVSGILSGSGIIDMNYNGYRGSTAVTHPVNQSAQAGEGKIGPAPGYSYCGYRENRGGGGGGHGTTSWGPDGGGGGGHASTGGIGENDHNGAGCSGSPTNGSIGGTCTFAGHFTNPILMVGGEGGEASGQATLEQLFFGGGGGGGGKEDSAGYVNLWGDQGGNGGAIIFIMADTINSTNLIIRSNGQNAINSSNGGGGGGGAGGSILIKGTKITLNSLNAIAGSYTSAGDSCAGGRGGNGSVGRIAVYYCDTFSGTSNPTAYSSQISCN